MKSTSSSMAAGAECGCRLKSATQYVGMPQPARASVTSVPYGFETVSSAVPSRAADLTPRLAGRFFAASGVSVREPDDEWSFITDNAKYHHATLHAEWRRKQEPDFVLHFLPPYSPQLNPIERVWKLLRRLRIHNRYFASIPELTESVDAQMGIWAKPNAVLKRLCSV